MNRNWMLALALLLAWPGAVGRAAEEVGAAAADPAAEPPGEYALLRREISLLNLLRGLYLSDGQLAALAPLARAAEEARAAAAAAAAAGGAELQAALRELRDGLYEPAGRLQPLRDRAAETNDRVAKRQEEALAERLGELEEQAEDILSDAQLEIVEAFKPCLVPPRDLRDPEAVGQAGRDTGGEERLLEAVRRMPPELYAQRRPVLVARLLGAIEREKGALEPGTRQSLAGALGARLDEARALDGADFALRRAELAGALYPFDEDVVYHRGKRQAGKVAQFLLGPGAAGVLERWREAQVRQPAAGATPAASAAPGAEAPLAPLGRPAPPAQVNQTLLLQAAKLLRDPERRLEQPERAAFRARLLALAARPAGDPGARGEIEALIGELDARQATALSLSCRRRRVQFLARERGLRARDRADAFGLGEILVEADRLEAAGDLAGANAALNRAEELIASLAD